MAGATEYDVIVVGAGPGGLFLACELALAGLRCKVLERRTQRSAESRATGLQARSLEILQLRGLAEEFLARGYAADHFRLSLGLARIDLRRLATDFQQLNVCPQSVTEELLERRASQLGAVVERGALVTGLRQDDAGVVLGVSRAEGAATEHASWVVGCDGAHSVVRESAGLGFPGKTYPYNVFVSDLRLGRPPDDGMLVQVNRHGLVVAIDFGNGSWRMGVVDRQRPRPAGEPVRLEEVGMALSRIFGRDLQPHEQAWGSRFVFHNRHATAYRRGRVIVAGDAAHVHAPLGAQGINISIQDSMNLGWKLAAVVRGQAPTALLDSYERERRPVADRVLAATDHAMRVMMSDRLPVRALRRVMIPTVLGIRPAHHFIAGQISGIATSYRRKGAGRDSLVGCRVPNASLHTADGTVQPLSGQFSSGCFVLVDQAGGRLTEAAAPWQESVRLVTARIRNCPSFESQAGVLIRPDGYCAWAGKAADGNGLRAALREWCGEPGRQPATRPSRDLTSS
jgi:2-polyprenyl-6-methoxyphenol hydroxylase-like FAD-dependent oxidoreductase